MPAAAAYALMGHAPNSTRQTVMTEHVENRFELFLEASKKFTQAMGLHDELMLEIFRAKSDWEFIIKIDAMLEAAAKAVVKKRLNSVPTEPGEDLSFDGFVDAMPMNGRTSLLAFLKVDGCPNDVSGFIEAVRRLRNGFAHDIRLTDAKLIEIIKARPDKSLLIKSLCQIEEYDEANLIKDYEKDDGYLRFGIADATLRFLIIAYNITNPEQPIITHDGTPIAPRP